MEQITLALMKKPLILLCNVAWTFNSKTSYYTGRRVSNNMKEKYVYSLCFETPVQEMGSVLKNMTL